MNAPADGDEPAASIGVRIGELSRRVGVSAELLRAWERRYQLLQPARSSNGYRLYTPRDELRIRAMQEQLARGLSAAEAARVARRAAPVAQDAATRHHRALRRALDAYDESDAQHVLDGMLRELSLATVLRNVVMPYLAELGVRWEYGTIDVAQEHFASNLIRGRLAGLAFGWGQGVGPRAVLACPEGELHDLALLAFGITLNRCGWRVTFLGAGTPVNDLDHAVATLHPDVVVLAATTSEPFESAAAGLRRLGDRVPVLLAGAGATNTVLTSTQARALVGDPVTEAQHLHVPARPEPVGAS